VIIFLLNLITAKRERKEKKKKFPWFMLFKLLLLNRSLFRDAIVINLAYIRKNCWNPEDLAVSIRGARRARARPTELPSTSAAPTPASTSAAPSVPA